MSPPAPIDERDFDKFLRDHGCEGRPRAKHPGIYRISDNKFITHYSVLHSKGKRGGVLICYKKNFLKALERIKHEESIEIKLKDKIEKTVQKQEDWQKSLWHQKWLREQKQQQIEEKQEEDDS